MANAKLIKSTVLGAFLATTMMISSSPAQAKNDHYFRVPPDLRDLNYGKYVEEGEKGISLAEDYNSHNTTRLDTEGMTKLLLKLPFIQAMAKGGYISPEE